MRCGNRRAADCPSCSRIYAADTFHLIRAGVTGGKGVPEQVGENPLVFATLTAPSFGLVHGTRGGRTCRPFTAKGQDRTCEHGRPTVCHDRDGSNCARYFTSCQASSSWSDPFGMPMIVPMTKPDP